MTPVLSDEQMKEAVSKYQDYLRNKGAEIVYEEHWGLKKLAYPIQKKSTGFYHLISFRCDGQLVKDLEIEFKRDERIIRFLTVALDKYGVAYNEKRKADKDPVKAKEE
jgi:small subunit ribosomal protein S6